MTIVGFTFIYQKSKSLEKIFSFDYSVGKNIIETRDNVGVIACIWFGLVNFLDLVFGLIFYPQYLGLLTAYVHHTLYIWMMNLVAFGNGIFFTAPYHSTGFVIVTIEELPTFLLALGSIFPSLRTDLGFGITFFFTRIAYHMYIFAFMIASRCFISILILMTITLLMHVHWFYGWVKKYGKAYVKKLDE
jgi:hypothetical protein